MSTFYKSGKLYYCLHRLCLLQALSHTKTRPVLRRRQHITTSQPAADLHIYWTSGWPGSDKHRIRWVIGIRPLVFGFRQAKGSKLHTLVWKGTHTQGRMNLVLWWRHIHHMTICCALSRGKTKLKPAHLFLYSYNDFRTSDVIQTSYHATTCMTFVQLDPLVFSIS